ncbi:hypothetical protein [Nocardia otitidiscaviarum]|nr:hypothetical protein [Nocardia otitidiscaviarum]
MVLAVPFIAAGLAAASAGAETPGLDFAAAKSCGFEFTYSRPSVYPPEIKGNGVAQCDVPPEEHILTLALEYKRGERWETAAHITDSAIPPGPPNSKSYEVSAACYAVSMASCKSPLVAR